MANNETIQIGFEDAPAVEDAPPVEGAPSAEGAPAVEGAPPAEGAPAPWPSSTGGRVMGWLKRGNSPLAVLFLAGLACVYLLSLRHGPAAASAEQQATETQVETALTQWRAHAKVPDASITPAAQLVATFYCETAQRQIPLKALGPNPFVFRPPASSRPKPLAAPAPSAARQDNTPLSEALAAVEKLRLQSVLTGPNGATAMISNNILTEGQTIAGWTIRKIDMDSVTLTWQDQTVVLKMKQ